MIYVYINYILIKKIKVAQNNYEAPPILTNDIKYEVRKKEIEIWRLFTSIDKKKWAPDTFIVFAREAIVGLDINKNFYITKVLKIE